MEEKKRKIKITQKGGFHFLGSQTPDPRPPSLPPPSSLSFTPKTLEAPPISHREIERLQATAIVATVPLAAVVPVFGAIRTHTGVPGAGCKAEDEGLRETGAHGSVMATTMEVGGARVSPDGDLPSKWWS